MIKKLIEYKEKKFKSWIEFIACFGTFPFEKGGFLAFLYGWGAILGLISLILILKIMEIK